MPKVKSHKTCLIMKCFPVCKRSSWDFMKSPNIFKIRIKIETLSNILFIWMFVANFFGGDLLQNQKVTNVYFFKSTIQILIWFKGISTSYCRISHIRLFRCYTFCQFVIRSSYTAHVGKEYIMERTEISMELFQNLSRILSTQIPLKRQVIARWDVFKV